MDRCRCSPILYRRITLHLLSASSATSPSYTRVRLVTYAISESDDPTSRPSLSLILLRLPNLHTQYPSIFSLSVSISNAHTKWTTKRRDGWRNLSVLNERWRVSRVLDQQAYELDTPVGR
jgi:hypothetical protein